RLLGAGPAFVPRNVDVVRDLVTVHRVGAAVAEQTFEQRLGFRGGRDCAGRLRAIAPHLDDPPAAVGAVPEGADRIGPKEVRFLSGGGVLVDGGDELPGPDQAFAHWAKTLSWWGRNITLQP